MAIKWFREALRGDELQVYNSELEALVYVSQQGSHAHIVRFIGAVSDFAGHAVIALELW